VVWSVHKFDVFSMACGDGEVIACAPEVSANKAEVTSMNVFRIFLYVSVSCFIPIHKQLLCQYLSFAAGCRLAAIAKR
jgi:hypothetical protein